MVEKLAKNGHQRIERCGEDNRRTRISDYSSGIRGEIGRLIRIRNEIADDAWCLIHDVASGTNPLAVIGSGADGLLVLFEIGIGKVDERLIGDTKEVGIGGISVLINDDRVGDVVESTIDVSKTLGRERIGTNWRCFSSQDSRLDDQQISSCKLAHVEPPECDLFPDRFIR